MNFVYNIPKDVKIIFVADFFSEQLTGGAELTTAAIIEKCPYKYFKINSEHVNQELIEKNKDKYWIIGNCANLSHDSIRTLVADKLKYSIIAYDYFYCKYRSSYFHKMKTGQDCDCHKNQYGKFVYGFYKNAQNVFFMSSGQMNEWKKLFPTMINWEDRLFVQGSTFSDISLDYLKELYIYKKQNNKKWAVLKGGSWIKNQDETEQYCKQNYIDYELIGGLDPDSFLKNLSNFYGFVFLPKFFDTDPRVIYEALCLGLKVIMNDNVQTKHENFLKKHPLDLIDYLRTRQSYIWEKIKI